MVRGNLALIIATIVSVAAQAHGAGPSLDNAVDASIQLTRTDLRLIERSEVEALQERFTEHPELVNASSYRSGACSPLAYAAALGHADVVEALIELDADLEARCHEESVTPLMLAIICSRQHEVNHALCPQHLASEIPVEDKHAVSALLLLEGNASLTATDAAGRQAIHLAALNGNAEVAKVLLEHGADASALDAHGWTPIIYAAQRNDAECIETIARSGGDVNQLDGAGFPALLHAVHLGHAPAARTLRQLGASCDSSVTSQLPDLLAAQADPATRRRLEVALGKSCLPGSFHDEL